MTEFQKVAAGSTNPELLKPGFGCQMEQDFTWMLLLPQPLPSNPPDLFQSLFHICAAPESVTHLFSLLEST